MKEADGRRERMRRQDGNSQLLSGAEQWSRSVGRACVLAEAGGQGNRILHILVNTCT